jgi:hypothetical protein
MKRQRQWILISVLALGLLLALAAGLSLAQEPEPPEGEVGVEGEVGAAAAVANVIPIQGRLTDDSGNPLNGTYSIRFRLYDAATGGTTLCEDEDNVAVTNGLFTANMDWCTASDIDGRQLYLGIQVEADSEMTPRQAIYPVPYAFSLKPGAIISHTTSSAIVHTENWHSSGRGLRGYAMSESGTNYGVVGASRSPDGYGGYFYNTTSGVGVYGQSDTGGHGVYGQGGAWGVYGVGTSQGVMGECGSSFGFAGYFYHNDGGLALVADSKDAADNDDIVRIQNNYNVKFKVQGDGDVYCDGAFMDGGADFAEMLPGQDGLEPGDVLAIGPDGQLTRSTDPYQTSVVGVYSTQPGFVGGAGDEADLTAKVPLAIVGVVPVKASAENGVIHPGDLLVTASTPGHAMRAGDNPPQGTVLGKALDELEEGAGVIHVLVTLQ